MQIKPVSPWWPLCLLALTGAAQADSDTGPFTVGASESVQHQSNITRTTDDRQADWLSTTEINGALNEWVGRNQLVAGALFDVNRYKKRNDLDANTYAANAAFNWNTVNDLSGSVGGDSRRRQYFYGFDGDLGGGSGQTLTRNLETDNHLFTNVQFGGPARWTIFGGADANQRTYSSDAFADFEERQWSAHAGTSYATSPDLSFGITGNVTHGVYPNFRLDPNSDALHDGFDMKSADLTTKWQASGASLVNATIGYTRAEYSQAPGSHYINGSLNWTWTPPSHFSVVLGLSRDSDTDTSTGGTIVSTSNLAGRSINNIANLAVNYELTGKTSLVATGEFTQRHYKNSFVPTAGEDIGGNLNGVNRTWQIGLNAHFRPTRTTDLSCGVSREVRTADDSIVASTPDYANNIAVCTAAIKFD